MPLSRSLSVNAFRVLVGIISCLLTDTALAQGDRPVQFDDATNHWAEACIQGVGQDELMKGYLDGRFRPDGTMTRAEFAAVIVKAFPAAPVVRKAPSFSDVPQDFWGRDAIGAAYERGFLAGYPGNLFRPAQAISRVQAMVIVENAQMLQRRKGSVDSDETVLSRFFSDAIAIPPYARRAIARATRSSLVVNYPNAKQLRPNDSITRGEATALLCRLNEDGSDARHYVPADYVAAFGYQFDAAGLPTSARPGPTLLQSFDSSLRDVSLRGGVEIGGRLFLIDEAGAEILVTDGTSNGTGRVRSLQFDSERNSPDSGKTAELLGVGDGRFWILTRPAYSQPDERVGLWSSDGTVQGTQEAATFSPTLAEAIARSVSVQTGWYPTRALKERVLLALKGQTGSELWITDGQSEAGTERLAAFSGVQEDGYGLPQQHMVTTDDYLFFVQESFDADRTTLWRTDGTLEGTLAVRDIDGLETYEPMLPWQNRIYFTANAAAAGVELWTSDGTSSGTTMLKDIYPGVERSGAKVVGRTEKSLFVLASSPEGLGLWTTEGTLESTRLVKLLAAGRRSTDGALHVVEDGRFFFQAATGPLSSGGIASFELWISDGTDVGTRRVEKELGTNSVEAVGWKGQLFFSKRSTDGQELWISDGTASGTRQLVDLTPGLVDVVPACPPASVGVYAPCPPPSVLPDSTWPRLFTVTNDFLYFMGSQNRLFRTDGTVQGTELVRWLSADNNRLSTSVTHLGETMLLASGRIDSIYPLEDRFQLFSISEAEAPPAFSQYVWQTGFLIEYPTDWYIKDVESDYLSIWNQLPSRSATFPPNFVKTEVWIRPRSFEEMTSKASLQSSVSGAGRVTSRRYIKIGNRNAFRAFLEGGENGQDTIVTIIDYPERTVQIVSSYASGETDKVKTILAVHQSFGFHR